ncbi:alpha/beta fold hydrolase [Nakamurella leprariae]|uniref:Alpha/beta hydrolase n=1 Tax=Nakamurella leprariae TaxID=2803911 RepID=A0A938Y492_9ACTN|nr:alpha/beta hydrolase [Nakamurella leprariae]MBM9465781.1 alpha/beta hydrolase [Nakamurella leprariae]
MTRTVSAPAEAPRSALLMAGPPPRDELAAWSDAPTDDRGLAEVPAFVDPAPPGWTELVDGRGVFVRRHERMVRSDRDPEPSSEPIATPDPDVPAWYVHGLGGSSTNWSRLGATLAPLAVGYSIDLPGSGHSDPPPGQRYSLTADADLLAATIRQVTGDRPVHLVGNSLGGMVVTALTARHPDLVATLTLISPAVPDLRLTTDRGADPRLAMVMLPGIDTVASRRLARITARGRAEGLARTCFGRPDLLSDEDLQAAADDLGWRFGLPWVHTSTLGSLRSLIASYCRLGRWSFPATAARIQVPVLVVWGTRDRLVDVRLSRRTADAFPDARLLVLPECGHVAQMELPAITAAAVAALWRRERLGDAV